MWFVISGIVLYLIVAVLMFWFIQANSDSYDSRPRVFMACLLWFPLMVGFLYIQMRER